MAVDRMWRSHDLKRQYDIVIIGAGVHGLAIAYYLARRGITNVAVLDSGYLGGGASGRNTAIIRSNYRTLRASPSTTRASSSTSAWPWSWTTTSCSPGRGT